jgi:hypothetical protein
MSHSRNGFHIQIFSCFSQHSTLLHQNISNEMAALP